MNITDRSRSDILLSRAVIAGNVTEVKRLLHNGVSATRFRDRSNGFSLLHLAAERKNNDILFLLMEHGADLHVLNDFGQPPICYAAALGNVDNLVELIGRGSDINWTCSDYGSTLLHLAAERGHTKVVKLLLKAGIKGINVQDTYGFTPLHYACQRGALQMCEVLIHNGADSTLVNRHGDKCLSLAPNTDARRHIAACILAPYLQVDIKEPCEN